MSQNASEAGAGRRVAAAALLLGASIALSRVLGFVRDAVLASQVGVGSAADAYGAAFQLPDLLNYFLAGGALSIAFIPLVQSIAQERGEAESERFFHTVLGTVGAFATVATVVLWLSADALVALQFPRFDLDQQGLTTRMTRILLPAQICFFCGGVIRGALMAQGRFGAQAAAPLLYNGAIIAGGLVLAPRLGVEGFAWGALLGAVLGPLGAALYEARGRLRLRARVAPLDADFRRYLVVAIPLMLGVSLLTVDEWFDRWFGHALGAGTIATLLFARRLMQAPVALVGQAIGTAALPTLTRLFQRGQPAELGALLLRTLQASLSLALLAAVALAVLAEPVVTLIYERGAFGPEDSGAVAAVLRVFCWAVPGWILQTIAVRAFYARGDTWRPMLLGTALAVAALPLYAQLGPDYGALGLAAAGAIAISVNALLTLAWARARHGAPALAPLLGSALRSLAAALPAGAAASFVLRHDPGALGALADLLLGGTVFVAVGVLLTGFVGDPVLKEQLVTLGRRLRRRRVG